MLKKCPFSVIGKCNSECQLFESGIRIGGDGKHFTYEGCIFESISSCEQNHINRLVGLQATMDKMVNEMIKTRKIFEVALTGKIIGEQDNVKTTETNRTGEGREIPKKISSF